MRATIAPVTDGRRPLWSVLIPTYNCARYLEECLGSVLSDDHGPENMEIIVVDDHSTLDDPEDVVKRIAGSRVRFVRQPQNVGKVRNFATGLQLSRGHLIHQLHGDDRVGPGFYTAMTSAFEEFPSAGAFFSESRYITADGEIKGRTGQEQRSTGILDNWLEKIVVSQRIQTPSIVVRRNVYEHLGGFDSRLDMVEDWEMWIRVANSYDVGFITDAVADYRILPSGTSAMEVYAGKVAQRIRKMISIVDEYLPASLVQRVKTKRNREVAQYLSEQIPQLVAAGKYGSLPMAYANVLRFSMYPKTIYRLMAYTLNRRAVSADCR